MLFWRPTDMVIPSCLWSIAREAIVALLSVDLHVWPRKEQAPPLSRKYSSALSIADRGPDHRSHVPRRTSSESRAGFFSQLALSHGHAYRNLRKAMDGWRKFLDESTCSRAAVQL